MQPQLRLLEVLLQELAEDLSSSRIEIEQEHLGQRRSYLEQAQVGHVEARVGRAVVFSEAVWRLHALPGVDCLSRKNVHDEAFD